ncbi:50S ribosomal protein L3 [bacterium]|nr:50S ribosomal protein L3 [bacterium]
MLNSVIGTKVGMTQLFDENGNVVPVTVVDINNLFVTQIKSTEKEGYNALQLGLVRNRFKAEAFSPLWLKAKSDYFLRLKEVAASTSGEFAVGQAVTAEHIALNAGDFIAVTGTSKGLGFQGVVKRWGFGGGPKTHGSKFHRRPGSSGHLRRQGEIIKGKRFPGHAGDQQLTVRGLKVIRIDKETGHLFIKGAIPGKKDSFVTIKKQGA